MASVLSKPIRPLLRPLLRRTNPGAPSESAGAPFAYFGVNISGPEFPPANANYGFPSDTDWNYLRSKGVKLVRLPIAWERMQPVLSGALDSTYMGLITTAIGKAAARGMQVIVDLHNFARWDTNYSSAGYPGQSGYVLGSANLTQAMLVDVWQKLATALVGLPGLAGYDIMNEPRDMAGTNLLTTPNYFTGPNWGVTNACVVTKLANGTNPLGASYGPAWTITSGSGFGSATFTRTFAAVLQTSSCYASVAAGTDTLVLRAADQNNGGVTVTTTPKRYAFAATPAAGLSTFQMQVNAASGHSMTVSNAQLEPTAAMCTSGSISGSVLTVGGTVTGTFAVGQEIAVAGVVGSRIISLGTGTGGAGTYNLSVSPGNVSGVAILAVAPYEPNPWTPYAQATVTAIRAIDATTPIYVGGYQYSSAKDWNKYNYELGGITGGNIIYEAHQYFDANGSGVYASSYAGEGATATTGSTAIVDFAAWLTANGFTGYLGEFGVPNDDSQWITLLDNFLVAAKAAGIPGAEWFYGTFSAQDGGRLNIAKAANGNADAPQMATLVRLLA